MFAVGGKVLVYIVLSLRICGSLMGAGKMVSGFCFGPAVTGSGCFLAPSVSAAGPGGEKKKIYMDIQTGHEITRSR